MLKDILVRCLPSGIITVIKKLYHMVVILTYYILRIFPIKNNKIIITSYCGRGYGDNGKYITEELLRRNLDFDIVWIVKGNEKEAFPEQIRTVRYGSLKAKYEEVTAKFWIDNCRKSYLVRKRKSQFYIQTWHGGIALKRIEKDAEHVLSKGYIKNAKHDSKISDLLISNSKFCTELYRSAFWYDGEILECGYPRNDILIQRPKHIRDKVYSFYNLDQHAKIALYAPTFRADGNVEVYDLLFEEIIKLLEKKYGCRWVFMVRLHPNISEKSNMVFGNKKVIDVTCYDDMQELMLSSEIFITDYSSTMFEFMLTGKPVFLYAKDIEKYKNERNFYFKFNSLPFSIAETNEELMRHILFFNKDEYIDKVESFKRIIGLKEKGIASKMIVNRIQFERSKNMKGEDLDIKF